MASQNSPLQSVSGGSTSPERASNATSNYSTTDSSGLSSRHAFRTITRDILASSSPTLAAPSVMSHGSLEPAKYNPQSDDSSQPSDASARYRSVVYANPFAEHRETRWPGPGDDRYVAAVIAPWAMHDYPVEQYTPSESVNTSPDRRAGLSQSHSAVNIRFAKPNLPRSTHNTSPTPRTGRSRHRDRSPARSERQDPSFRYLDGLMEEVYLDEPASPIPKRPRSPMKKMFGENGWLGRSTSMRELPTEARRGTGGFRNLGERIWRRVEGLSEDVIRLLPSPFGGESSLEMPSGGAFQVSLDMLAQASIYSEVELMICVTANAFLIRQFQEGRLSAESLEKTAEHWRGKGRPQVIEFQFDQATQRDLIQANLKNVRFEGELAGNRVTINSMLYNWKVLSKEMAVRTFCAPDPVVKKHLYDIRQILDLLGAPDTTFNAFSAVQVRTLAMINAEQDRRKEIRAGSAAAGHAAPNVPIPVAAGPAAGAVFRSFEGLPWYVSPIPRAYPPMPMNQATTGFVGSGGNRDVVGAAGEGRGVATQPSGSGYTYPGHGHLRHV